MKVISGKITRIVPQGGYNGRNGYIYTFDMTVQCAEGTVTGEIGSKSEVYPLVVGDSITVEASQSDHGPRLKKINPEYSGQSRGNKKDGRDYDKENRGKCRLNLIKATIVSGISPMALVNDSVALGAIETLVKISMEGLGGQPNPDYQENPPKPKDDDSIPF